jgi:hypothetical protein
MNLNQDQIRWLDRCTAGTWKLDPDTDLVDVDGSFVCVNEGLTDFKGIKFGKISGYFDCHDNQLTSLEGSPEKVGGSFHCYSNQLTSLNGAPESVGSNFLCMNNQLTSLAGSPKEVGLNFSCSRNQLTSLMGAPKSIGRDLYCVGNYVSERTILAIYELMKRSKSYPEALSEYWCEITEKDRSLMYADNPELSADEKRGYELMNRVKGISI